MHSQLSTVFSGPDEIAEGTDPQHRILRRVDQIEAFPCTTNLRPPFMTVAVIDTETTGFDPGVDEVIEIAAALLRIDAFGLVVEVLDSAESLRNPGVPIPPDIERLTWISDAMVEHVEFDPAPFIAIIERADVCVAHNAAFDAPFVERLLPQIAGKPWACSLRQFDWRMAGFDGSALGHLLTQIGRFNDAHRAMDDVISLIHVLAHECDAQGSILSHVIRTASENTIRIEATGAPFDRRGLLKSQGYRWDGLKKVWWTEASWLLAPLEEAWLQDQVLPSRCKPSSFPVTWRERFR